MTRIAGKLANLQKDGHIAGLIEQAKQDWLLAQSLFDNVIEPEMVDHAIHRIIAAEKKYAYLLRLAKSGTDLETSTIEVLSTAFDQPSD